jgi:leucyl-tRNA synthetase
VHQQAWPVFDRAKASAARVTLVLQVNGRVRDRVEVPAGITEEEARDLALKNARVRQFIEEKPVANIIVVPGKLVNVVVH